MINMGVESLVMGTPPAMSCITLRSTQRVGDGPEAIKMLLPIFIGPTEAASIGMSLSGKISERPMTHDLFVMTLGALDARLDHVLINKVEGRTFYCCLVLRSREGYKSIDSRPSDAIALALRLNAPIYAEEEVLSLAGMPETFREGASNEIEMEAFHSFIDNINPEDFNA